MEFVLQTSSSVLPALDTVRIASSIQMLTSGMLRGRFYPIASIAIPETTPLTLQDLCLILNMFPTFSLDYKLREEQCYWFCDVVFSLASAGCDVAAVVREEGWARAGRFGSIAVRLSEHSRQFYVDTYTILWRMGSASDSTLVFDVSAVSPEAIASLVKLLEATSHDAQRRTTMALASVAQSSKASRELLVLAGAAVPLLRFVSSADSSCLPLAISTLESLSSGSSSAILPGTEDTRLLSILPPSILSFDLGIRPALTARLSMS